MIKLRSHKVLELPTVPETNSIYYVVAPTSVDYLEIYVTGSTAGVVRRLPNINDISVIINALFADFTPIVFVADIPTRDLLDPDYTVMAIVEDASADITVSSGQAVYVYNILTDIWVKISQSENPVSWGDIAGGPTSAPADIDDAVDLRHTHTNLSILETANSSLAKYTHEQAVPDDTWVVNHNLGYRPTVAVYTSGWVLVEVLITHVSVNQVLIEMNGPIAGFAVCN